MAKVLTLSTLFLSTIPLVRWLFVQSFIVIYNSTLFSLLLLHQSKLVSDLRIGSVLDIGEEPPLPSAFNFGQGHKGASRPTSPLKYARIGYPTYFPPISLLVAREQGDCGSSSRYHRLRDFYSSRVSTFKACDERPRWPPNQSFQQHIQGSLWSVSSFGLSAVYQVSTLSFFDVSY